MALMMHDPQPAPLMVARDLTKTFRRSHVLGIFGKKLPEVRAVDGLNLAIGKGDVYGLIGESGCGKTTTARLLMRLETPSSGSVRFDGADITACPPAQLSRFRRSAQMIFQDPYESMNPGMTIEDIVAEPLVVQKVYRDRAELRSAVARALERIDLTPPQNYLGRYPHQLSGGQRQRVAIARALVLSPVFIAADEPTSMLDVSVRSGILNLMLSLKEEMGLTYLFITHDLSVAKYVCDHIGVMYNGRLVETGPADEVIRFPIHPYTRALTTVVGDLSRFWQNRASIIRDVDRDQRTDQGCGCRFAPRCPRCVSACWEAEPTLSPVATDRHVSCHCVT
jgi:oligopeptide/dipeptide ABC transporter ATP-binding protein